MPEGINDIQQELEKVTQSFNAMHLSQLTAYAYGLPPLFFCSQYYELSNDIIIEQCNQRLTKLLTTEKITMAQIHMLLTEKEYFDEYEANLRVAPTPDE